MSIDGLNQVHVLQADSYIPYEISLSAYRFTPRRSCAYLGTFLHKYLGFMCIDKMAKFQLPTTVRIGKRYEFSIAHDVTMGDSPCRRHVISLEGLSHQSVEAMPSKEVTLLKDL